jgi:hypothetical protein
MKTTDGFRFKRGQTYYKIERNEIKSFVCEEIYINKRYPQNDRIHFNDQYWPLFRRDIRYIWYKELKNAKEKLQKNLKAEVAWNKKNIRELQKTLETLNA